MSHPHPLSQWMETVSTAFPKLGRPQAKVLTYWSYGMLMVVLQKIFGKYNGQEEMLCVQLKKLVQTGRQ